MEEKVEQTINNAAETGKGRSRTREFQLDTLTSTVSNEGAGATAANVPSSFPDLRFPREELVPPFCSSFLELGLL